MYFVINLNKRKKDIRHLVGIIEKSIMSFYPIIIFQQKMIRKILVFGLKIKNCAIGIRVKKWIAFHGCSINLKIILMIIKKLILAV